MKRTILLFSVIITGLVSGCTSVHTNVVLSEVTPREPQLEIARRGSGIGSCGYVTNSYWGGDIIKLIGSKSRYETGDFAFTGERSDRNKTATGFIAVDRSKKEAEIAIVIAGQPYEFNGHYRL
jgi:hypothetical protein